MTGYYTDEVTCLLTPTDGISITVTEELYKRMSEAIEWQVISISDEKNNSGYAYENKEHFEGAIRERLSDDGVPWSQEALDHSGLEYFQNHHSNIAMITLNESNIQEEIDNLIDDSAIPARLETSDSD